jgi:hypothetical protein
LALAATREFKMVVKGGGIAMLLGFVALVSCRTTSPKTALTAQDQAAGAKRCRAYVAPTLQTVFARTHDAFRNIVLGDDSAPRCLDADNAQPDPDYFRLVDTMLKAANCRVERISVSETAAAFDPPVLARAVDRWTCPSSEPADVAGQIAQKPSFNRLDNVIWVADVVAKDQGLRDGFEIIAWDRLNQVHAFYTAHRGAKGDADFVFSGTSFQMATDDETQQGFAGSHPCLLCHTNGVMVMKELENPWMNWTPQGQPEPKNTDALNKLGTLGDQRSFFVAKELEAAVRQSATAIADERAARAKAGPPASAMAIPDFSVGLPITRPATLRDLLKPLFCETEVNLLTTIPPLPDANAAPEDKVIVVPERLFVAKELSERFKFGIATVIDSDKWRALFAAKGVSTPARNLTHGEVPERAMLMPSRAIADIEVGRSLVKAQVLEPAVANAAMMVDFQNSIFSRPRCSLAALVPATDLGELRSAAGFDAAKVTKLLRDAMGAAGTAPAKEFLANLDATSDQQKAAYRVFTKACQNTDNPKRITAPENLGDLFNLIQARNRIILANRSADPLFRHLNNFAMETGLRVHQGFPDGLKLVANRFDGPTEVRLDRTTCGIERPALAQ